MTTGDKVNNLGFKFKNTYIDLPKKFYSEINLDPVRKPEMIILNKGLANNLGLDINGLQSKEGIEILAGNKKVKDGEYIAQAYAGHQFGHFNMLGDGRALLIGEQVVENLQEQITGLDNRKKLYDKYDLQLKGSGRTPYSRGGDGRAVLGPMLREYIVSEGMYNLKIPTTRILAVLKTGEKVYREYVKEGAILTRVATSHLRFATFEYAANFLGKEYVKTLADYAIDTHYSYLKDEDNKYLGLLKEVIKVQAYLVAKWMSVGFIHGVMNTDNMTISGETIDYGPCAFMDTYNPDTVFSSIDVRGRYAYKNQPNMASWNICRFAETLLPLIDNNTEKAVDMAQKEISKFSEMYYKNWLNNMRAKLGIFDKDEQDKVIVEDLLNMMEKYKEDYTNTFVSLTYRKNMNRGMFLSTEFTNWHIKWQNRLEKQRNISLDGEELKEDIIERAYNLMKKSNPVVIPRNHKVEEALKAADNGDYQVMLKLLSILENPFEYKEEFKEYMDLPEPSDLPYRTYCGT